LALSVTGCGASSKDKSWAVKLGDETISAGVYVLNVMAGLNTASMKVAEGVSDFMTADIEGKTGSQLVKDYAMDETKRQLATHAKFVELGLSMSEAEKSSYESYAKEMYAGDSNMYKANGVSEQSLIDYNRYSMEAYKVFQKVYGPEGEKAATQAEMNTYFTENYNLAYVVPYLKVDGATSAPLEGDAKTKMLAESDAAFKAIKDGTKSIVEVVYEVGSAQLPEGTAKPERGDDADYMMVVEKQNVGTFPPIVYEHLAKAENGSLEMVEDDIFRLIIQKIDETKAPEKLVSYYYLQMLPEMKQQEYLDLTLEWANAAKLEINQPAIDHFSGEKVKKETDAYMAAQSSSAAANAPSSLPADAETAGNAPAPEASAPASESAPATSSSSTAG
ncbi:MAG: hypothetical protein RR209_02680, partial [Angelakisella sp.]